MTRALALAAEAAKQGEVPVGCVIVDAEGVVLAAAGNRCEMDGDPTAHAEMLAIRAALAAPRRKTEPREAGRLSDCSLYVTLEPCPMCAQAISFARLRRLYFGAYDPKGGGVDHGPRIFQQSSCHHRLEIYGGLRERECAALLADFFRARR